MMLRPSMLPVTGPNSFVAANSGFPNLDAISLSSLYLPGLYLQPSQQYFPLNYLDTSILQHQQRSDDLRRAEYAYKHSSVAAELCASSTAEQLSAFNAAAALMYTTQQEHNTSRHKRVRTAFTPTQLSRLESQFATSPYVVGQQRRKLSSDLRLSETQVKVWFQNRRTKEKRVIPCDTSSQDFLVTNVLSSNISNNSPDSTSLDDSCVQSTSPLDTRDQTTSESRDHLTSRDKPQDLTISTDHDVTVGSSPLSGSSSAQQESPRESTNPTPTSSEVDEGFEDTHT